MTITLKKPIKYNEKEYKEINLDFDKLTGADALAIERELLSINILPVLKEYNGEYIIRIAAKAASEQIGSDFFRMLSIRDYNAVEKAVRDYLKNAESSAETEENG